MATFGEMKLHPWTAQMEQQIGAVEIVSIALKAMGYGPGITVEERFEDILEVVAQVTDGIIPETWKE